MSDELRSQFSQATVPDKYREQHQQSGTGFEQASLQQQQQHYQSQPYQYLAANNNYLQRGGRNGHQNAGNRQSQQRGSGRFAPSKYAVYSTSPGQYARYTAAVGNGNRNYNAGYKTHRAAMNSTAATTAMNMQWPGYYNAPPPIYYVPQLVPASNAPAASIAAVNATSNSSQSGVSRDASSSGSPVSLMSGSSTPQPRKIEITTKTGQHLDLSTLHGQGSANSTPPNNNDNNVSTVSNSHSNNAKNENKNQEPSKLADSIIPQTKRETSSVKEKSKAGSRKDAERTRREFLEQIKLRKQAMERKKREEALNNRGGKTKTEQYIVAGPATEGSFAPATRASLEDGLENHSVSAQGSSRSIQAESSSANLVTPPATASVGSDDCSSKSNEQQKDRDSADQQPGSGTYAAAKLAAIKQQKAQGVGRKAETERKVESGTLEQKAEAGPEKQDQGQPVSINPGGEQPSTNPSANPSANPFSNPSANPSSENPTSKTVNVVAENKEDVIEDPALCTMSQLLERLRNVSPIEDIYAFEYPESVERPDPKYRSSHRKYTYGPTFLLQFKDKVRVKPDEEWVQQSVSKIVITPNMMRLGKPRDAGGFLGGPGGRGGDFRKSGSLRNMEGRSNSRSSSKKKSKRMMDERKSNRPYTSRRERERNSEREADEQKEDERAKEEVKPLVPSANRWVPKSKMKKTEKKLAPDGVTELLEKEDAERKMKSLLNKLTLEMFDQISSQILQIADQSKWEKQGETLKIVIEQIFHKACDEPHWSSMYAQLCGKVVKELNPEISDETNEGKKGPKLVLHYLVARCHEEFDKGWTDKLPTKEDGSPLEPEMMSDEYYRLAAAKRRGLGLVRFIGYLYRLNLLTGKMMFECFRRLMKDLSNAPSEETLESVVELLSTVGEQFETDSFSAGHATLEGSVLLDNLFDTLQSIIDESVVSSRMKFKLIDIKELREDKHWNSNKKQDGPKTIQQIHEEEKERQMKNSSSRNNTRRGNNSMGSRRENSALSKDSFISTRSSSSSRYPQKSSQKEDTRKPEKSAINMYSALMDSNEDED